MENQVMASQEIVIVGAGGHGREVLDVLRAQDPDCETLKFFASCDAVDERTCLAVGSKLLSSPAVE